MPTKQTKPDEQRRAPGRPRRKYPVRLRVKPENLSDAELLELAVRNTKDPDTGAPITDKRFAEAVLFINPRMLRKRRGGQALRPLERAKCLDIAMGKSAFPA